jgi:hypothetical protein
MSKFSAIGIKKIWYGPALSAVATKYVEKTVNTGLSPAELKAFLALATTKQVPNVHADTWKYEKAKPTKTYYKNKLTGKNYRASTVAGDSKITFSIGEYDFATKADFEGGTASDTKYSAPEETVDITYTLVALTEDGVYFVYSKADIAAGGVTTDDAVAIEVEATALESDVDGLEAESHIAKSAVDAAVAA